MRSKTLHKKRFYMSGQLRSKTFQTRSAFYILYIIVHWKTFWIFIWNGYGTGMEHSIFLQSGTLKKSKKSGTLIFLHIFIILALIKWNSGTIIFY